MYITYTQYTSNVLQVYHYNKEIYYKVLSNYVIGPSSKLETRACIITTDMPLKEILTECH